MKPGLIITHVSTLENGLKAYDGVFPYKGGYTFTHRIGRDAADAVRQFVEHYGPGLVWLSGSAATKRLAKNFSLEYRKRAPGGGRKRISIEEKVKSLTIWMHPKAITRFKRVAKYLGAKSLGDQVATWSIKHDPDPLRRHRGE